MRGYRSLFTCAPWKKPGKRMEYAISNQNQKLEVHLSGQLTFADHQKFKHIIEVMAAAKPEVLEMHFASVDFIDSAGLGMLLLLRDQCQNQNISLFLHSVRGQVEKIFIISRFDQLFTLRP